MRLLAQPPLQFAQQGAEVLRQDRGERIVRRFVHAGLLII